MGHYFRRERLEGDNAYKCDKCKSKVPATKKFSIERAPNVLCIQLKRFGLMGGKMSKHIQFSRQLNLNRFLFNPNAGSSVAYKFVSLINHMGPSQHCGHYTAIAEASNGQLYLFDDCSVRLISLNMALSTGAYVLMYEKVHQSTSHHQNSASKIQNSAPKIQNSAPKIQNKLMTPRPALITEPPRAKINFQVKKTDPTAPTKPRLVIHNGNSLFKSSSTAPTAPAPAPAPAPAKHNTTALVPYEKSDEEDSSTDVTRSAPPAEKPLETPLNASSTTSNWIISENSNQDSGSSGSSSSSSGSGKWMVRSFSDTESTAKNEQKNGAPGVSHSDTEINDKRGPASQKFGDKIRLLTKKIFGPASTKDLATDEAKDKESATLEPEKTEDPQSTNATKKWDGSLNTTNNKTDTVKELLKMSHSGYNDQGLY